MFPLSGHCVGSTTMNVPDSPPCGKMVEIVRGAVRVRFPT